MSTTYKLEVWGARSNPAIDNSRSINIASPLAGYSHGIQSLALDKNIYICIGGAGNSNNALTGGAGGYNGGGKGGNGMSYAGGAAGGGATHIANTNRGELKNYKSFQSEILIVAGGGGGSTWYNDCPNVTGGVGGGISGGNGSSYQNAYIAYGGSQTNGYDFGQGQDGLQPTKNGGHSSDEGCGGGGGGWYGGKSSNAIATYGRDYNTGGGGGSGHIGTSVTNGMMLSGVREGNGYAIITWHPTL